MNKVNLSLLTSAFLYANLYATTTDEVVVYGATKSNQSIQDVTSNVSIISGAELENKQITTISQALNLVNGVSFTANGGMGKTSSVRIRGFDSKRALVLIDGIRYNDLTSTVGAPFEHIMLDNIDRIEVIKGAQSGIWGADASAGIVNIITKPTKEGSHIKVHLERGSFDTQKHGFMISQKVDKMYLQTSFNEVRTDGFTAYAQNGDDIDNYEDDGYRNKTFNFKTGYEINDNNKLDIQYFEIKNKNQFDNFNGDSLTHASLGKTRISKVNYEHRNNHNVIDFYLGKTDFFRNFPSFFSKYDGVVDELGIKSNVKYDKKSFIVLGVDYKKFYRADVVNRGFNNKGLFLTNSNSFGEKLILTESIRYDKNSAFDDKTTGKIGVKYNTSKDLSFIANIGTAYNIPSLGELYGAFGANPDLQPETTKSYDIGVQFQDVKVTYFYNTIENLIEYTSRYNNVDGTSKIKGFELEYLKNITDTTLVTLNYTALDAKDKDGQDLARRADRMLKFGVDYYGMKNLHLGLNGEYVGDRLDTGKQQTGKYTVANFVANYSVSKSLKTYLKVDNITNKYYQTVYNYATSPRAYYVGLKYTF